MKSERDIGALALRYAPLLACAAVLLWHSLQYNFITDDAYISFVYSRNLAEQGALVFNPGDAVEGYTNFLWTFLLGILMKVGLPPEIMSRVLGTGFALGTLWIAFRLVEYLGSGRSAWDFTAPALLAFSAGFACWSSGGLETQMFTFFVALAFLAYARADGEQRWFRWVGVALALASLTRPEGLLVTATIGVHRLALNLARDRRLAPTNHELMCIAGFLLLWAPYFAWRWWYYGHPFPNTYYVKAAGEVVGKDYHSKLTANGLYYVWTWLVQTKLLYVSPLLVIGLAVAKPRTPRFAFGTAALAVMAVYLAYTVRVGGDFMGLHRFIMPLFFIAAVAVVLGLRLLASLVTEGRARQIGAASVLVVLLGLYGHAQIALTVESLRWGNFENDRGIDTPAFLAVYTRDRAAVGKHMKHCFAEDDFAVFGGVGAQPYYSEVDGLDLFGLVSWDVAHCQPRETPRAGHNKAASVALLLKQPRRDGHFCPPRRGKRYVWNEVDGGPPDFWFARYAIHASPIRPANWQGRGPPGGGYERVTLHIGCTDDVHTSHPPGWKPAGQETEQWGKFYSFYVHKERLKSFACKGRVER